MLKIVLTLVAIGGVLEMQGSTLTETLESFQEQEVTVKGVTVKRYCLYRILLGDVVATFPDKNDFGVTIESSWKGGVDKLALLVKGQHHLKELNLDEPPEERLTILVEVLQLEGLYLFGKSVTDKNLVSVGQMESLVALHLINTSITNHTLERLAKLRKLRLLNLSMANISDDGLVHLKNLDNLEVLLLDGTNTTHAALEILKSLKKLRKLRLANGDVFDR